LEISHGYLAGSKASLENARDLLNGALILFDRSNFGLAQSIAVVSIEEAGKAVVLGLASLGKVTKHIIERTMKEHRLKKILLLGISHHEFLFRKELIGPGGKEIIDHEALKGIENLQTRDLERKRLNGFYVDVDWNSGVVTNTPRRIDPEQVKGTIRQAEIYVRLSETLCKIVQDIQKRQRSRVTMGKVTVTGLDESEGDYTVTISFDEI